MKPISTQNAKHYNWGATENSQCDGWHLVQSNTLSIIQERMPPGTKEVVHYHERAEQFFFILQGNATMIVEGETLELETHQGVHIPAGTLHQMKNLSDSDLHFTVTSTPPSQGDRVIVTES